MSRETSPIEQVARLVGAVFLLVGIAGFIPGITTNLYSGLPFAVTKRARSCSGSSR
ncbi:MAG TPA: DUF4383 domain-containing protein [Thermoleophilaceae bacterium]|nr:DUF4383 domain-containing protein [Thermoleophilaceae bacterium]